MDDSPFAPFPMADAEVPTPAAQPSHLKRVFRNRFGHWRAGWRILVYFVAAIAVGKVFSTPLKVLVPDHMGADFTSWLHMLVWVVGSLALILAGLGLLKWFDRRPMSLLGLGFGPGWLRELLIGLVAGLAMTSGVVLVLIVTRSVSLEFSPNLGASLAAMPRYLALFTLAGAVEELMFRGYPLQALAEGSRRWIAVVLLCLPFTIGHFDNPDMTIVGALNVFLLGILLAVIYFKTRRLWMPIGLHLSWNLAQSWLWGFDVSGIKIDNQLFVINPTGAEVLTGGEFGLEGSVMTSLLSLVVLGWILFGRTLKPTVETAAMWARYPSGFGIAPVADTAGEERLTETLHEGANDPASLADADADDAMRDFRDADPEPDPVGPQ